MAGVTRPFCVGLTGGVGAGKSTVAERFASHGVAVIDTDVISRDLTSVGGAAMAAILDAFGPEVVDADGALNRPAMRARVFANPADKQALEAILHPLIRENAARSVFLALAPYAVLVVPLLAENLNEYRGLVDRILVVDCDEREQIRRISTRPTMNEADARAMLAAQSSRATRLDIADDVLDNRGDLAMLAAQTDKLHQKYLDIVQGRGT